MAIDITGIDLRKFVSEVYNISNPVGMGFLQYMDGEIPEETLNRIVEQGNNNTMLAIHMDYVHGRQCKMTVFKSGDQLRAPDFWYDHTEAEYVELLKRCGIDWDNRIIV